MSRENADLLVLRFGVLRRTDRNNREGSQTLAGFPDRGTQRFPN